MNKKCNTCKKIFHIPKCRKNTAKYCSYKCLWLGNKKQLSGNNNSNWKGGRIKISSGYVIIKSPGHYHNTRGYMLEHRYLMEKHIGRTLKTSENIHHINGIKDDNRIENLIKLSHSEHNKIHKSKLNKWSMCYEQCVACKTKKIKYAGNGLCKKCYNHYKPRITVSRKYTRENLQ